MKKVKNKTNYRLADLAEKIGAKLDGDGSIEINAAAPIDKASAGDITFIANPKYLPFLKNSKASAIVLDDDLPVENIAVLRHSNPYYAFSCIIDILYPDLPEVALGVDASSIINETAKIKAGAAVGPLCHINGNSSVGENSRLVSSIYVGRNATIGSNCIIYPGVRIMDDSVIGNNVIIHSSTVIGSDGFGFAESDTGLKKIKQIGNVVIEDNVEIGSNCSVDRGALGPTKIGMGTKIDNLVQIAHNVEIGRHCIIVAQVGISGSTKLGNGVVVAGQAGLAGHIEIGDGVRIGGQTGVTKSIKAGKTVFGSPARDLMKSKKLEAYLSRLPDLFKRVKNIEDEKA